jgi:endonuclease/exonuclease/phosphatase family metal-dependent hydrolase
MEAAGRQMFLVARLRALRIAVRLLLAALCAAATCASAAGAAREATPLRLMTYNIRLDLASDGANAWPHRRVWVASQVEWLRPDLFGMQEVTPGQKAELIADLPRYRFIGGGRDDGKEKGEASPIAFDPKKLELLDSGLFWLSPTPTVPSKGWDAAYNRVATWVRLRVRSSKQVVLAVNTHWDHIGIVARQESAKQMLGWIERNSKPCQPVLLFGDFNSDLNSEQMRLLTGSALGLREARAASKTTPVGPKGTFNGFKPDSPAPHAIDHLLLGRGVEVDRYLVLTQVIDGRWPSDHFPVLIDVTVPACR